MHHALTGVLEPIFERSFVFDSYACRKGKGTHAAVDRCQQFARRYRYVLKTVKERTDIAADGHPAGTPGTGGVERFLPRENGQRLVDGEREEEEWFDLSAGIAWFGAIIRWRGRSSRSGPVRSLQFGGRWQSSQRGRVVGGSGEWRVAGELWPVKPKGASRR